jgi:hypothetical protein
MDFNVYFTVCPYCGFNYRIHVSPFLHQDAVGLGSIAKAVIITATGAAALFCVVWFLLR